MGVTVRKHKTVQSGNPLLSNPTKTRRVTDYKNRLQVSVLLLTQGTVGFLDEVNLNFLFDCKYDYKVLVKRT